MIILDEIDRICNKTKLLSSNEENILKIGYLKKYGGYELQKAIANFTSKYKKIDLHIISGTHEELLSKNNLYAKMWEDYKKSISWKVKDNKNIKNKLKSNLREESKVM